MFSTIFTKIIDDIGLITLNSPETLNAMDMTMRNEIRIALEGYAAEDQIRVVVITGSGKAFCAGGNVKDQAGGFDAMAGRERVLAINRLLMTMVMLEKPIICSVNGIAVGAGFSLALAGDLIIASENAKFSQAYCRIGLVPDFGGMYFLPRILGLQRAKEMIFTGETIGANEAKEIGLINRVVPREDLESATFELARRIAQGSQTATRLAKSILNRSLDCDLPTILELEANAQGICFQSSEHRELLDKFLSRSEGPSPIK
jgi:2-(1,2-epoxy-1,2-dihydrophenyl)acetyl-CoA isomerase